MEKLLEKIEVGLCLRKMRLSSNNKDVIANVLSRNKKLYNKLCTQNTHSHTQKPR